MGQQEVRFGAIHKVKNNFHELIWVKNGGYSLFISFF